MSLASITIVGKIIIKVAMLFIHDIDNMLIIILSHEMVGLNEDIELEESHARKSLKE